MSSSKINEASGSFSTLSKEKLAAKLAELQAKLGRKTTKNGEIHSPLHQRHDHSDALHSGSPLSLTTSVPPTSKRMLPLPQKHQQKMHLQQQHGNHASEATTKAVRNDKGVPVVVAPSTKTKPHTYQPSRSSMIQPQQHANGGPSVPIVTPAPSHRSTSDRGGAAVPTPPLSDKGKGNRDSVMQVVAPPDLAHDLSAGYTQQRRRPKASARPYRKAPLAVGHGNASTTAGARPKTVDQARQVTEVAPVAPASSPPPRTAHHRESATAESSSARVPDPLLVIEAVRKQEEAVKQLTRKRRRGRTSAEEPLNIDGLDPESIEAIEVVLAAERAESVRSTRSRNSSSFSQGSAATEESPVSSSTSRRGRHSSGDSRQMVEPECSQGPASPPCPRESQSVALDPGCRRVPNTPGSDKADGHESSFVAHARAVDGVTTRRQSGKTDTDEMLAGGVAWPSLGGDAGGMSCQLAARQSLWFPEDVACVAIHPSGSNIAVAVASGRQVAVYYGVGGGGGGGGGGGSSGHHDWTNRTLIDPDDNVDVLGVCFASCGTRLVVGGRFAESGVLCRVYDTTCVEGGRERGRGGGGATKWLNLRIESGGCLYSMTPSDDGSTLFTCGWSEDGMVVTVALWDLGKIIGDDAVVTVEPRLLLSPYHSGSPLVALHAVRGGADALLIGANSHRAVLWDRHTGVQIATIALDLGDAMVLPPDRPSVTCFDAIQLPDNGGVIASLHLRRWDSGCSDGCTAGRCPRVLLRWDRRNPDDGPLDGTSCVLDEVDAVVAADGSDGGVDDPVSRRATCAVAVGKYYAIGDSEGRMRVIEPFSSAPNSICAMPIATVGPVRYPDAAGGVVQQVACCAIGGNDATRELCMAMGRLVYLLR